MDRNGTSILPERGLMVVNHSKILGSDENVHTVSSFKMDSVCPGQIHSKYPNHQQLISPRSASIL